MNWQYWLPILLSIILGIPGFLALRKSNEYNILFFEVDNINLYNKILKNFDNIKIAYKEVTINHEIFLLRGIFLYSGKKDISQNDIIKNISIKLVSNGLWKEANIISESLDLNASIIIKNEEIIFDFALIKNEDYIFFEALGEAETSTFNINHRIKNVGNIKNFSIHRYNFFDKNLFYVVGFLCGWGAVYIFNGTPPFQIHYSDITTSYYKKTLDTMSYDAAIDKFLINKQYWYKVKYDKIKGLTKVDSIQTSKRSAFDLYEKIQTKKDSLMNVDNLINFQFDHYTPFIPLNSDIIIRFHIGNSFLFYYDLFFIIISILTIIYLIDYSKRYFRRQKILKIITKQNFN